MKVTVFPLDYVVIALYFVGIMICGLWFGRGTKSTKDFFFGGQRFSWWLVAVSCVATLVGSYSFVFYAETGFNFGISSTVCYTNDWFVLPLFILVWLPIIYFSRVSSIPEYFQRRFDEKTRVAALCVILIYLIGYIGINLYTIGTAVHGMLGFPVLISAMVVALVSAIYMHGGGQTSVIMTDFFQGFILLTAGFLVFGFGLAKLGGWTPFWSHLPQAHKLPFPSFNSPSSYHAVGVFWSDAITGTIAFYCMNQGILMRFMSAKSVREGKKAIVIVVLFMMPIAAIAVSNAGWIGRAMVGLGILPADLNAKDVFVKVANFVCPPGVFGLVMAALVAALMSTLDTLINAASAIAINDIWRTKIKPGRSDAYYLEMARYFALLATGLGILLVPVFAEFKSIFQAFSHFTSMVTPPMIVVITLGALWKGFTASAAFWTLILGTGLNILSLKLPQMITPFAHGAAGMEYSYMRAFFGVVVSTSIGVAISLVTKARKAEEIPGLVLATIPEGQRAYKGGVEPNEEGAGKRLAGRIEPIPEEEVVADPNNQLTDLALAHFAEKDMEQLAAREGDILYISDACPFFGGLRSLHVKAGPPHQQPGVIRISAKTLEHSHLKPQRPVTFEKII